MENCNEVLEALKEALDQAKTKPAADDYLAVLGELQEDLEARCDDVETDDTDEETD